MKRVFSISSRTAFAALVLIIGFQSCTFRQNVLFRTDSEIKPEVFTRSYIQAMKNYTIEPSDFVAISVFTNKGEILLDPNREFQIGNEGMGNMGGGMMGGGMMNQPLLLQGGFNTRMDLPITRNDAPPNTYLVNKDGSVNLPMVGVQQLSGYTLREADSLLAAIYSEFYEEPYVVTQYLNKRVILLGALGDRIIPMNNEEMSLIEILALSGEFQNNAKATNIRIIRGNKNDPSVQIVDLSTIEGMKRANLEVFPNDIIYVEPRRKVDRQTIGDLNAVLAGITSLATVYLLINSLIDNNN